MNAPTTDGMGGIPTTAARGGRTAPKTFAAALAEARTEARADAARRALDAMNDAANTRHSEWCDAKRCADARARHIADLVAAGRPVDDRWVAAYSTAVEAERDAQVLWHSARSTADEYRSLAMLRQAMPTRVVSSPVAAVNADVVHRCEVRA